MNIDDINRRNAMSFASAFSETERIKREFGSSISEVERIKRDFGLSGRVSDELRRATEAIAGATRLPNYLVEQLNEAEKLINRHRESFGQLDSIAARGSAMLADAEKAIARHNEMFGNAAAGIAARQDQIFGNSDRFAARHSELLGSIGKEYSARCDELLGIAGRAQNALDMVDSVAGRFSAQNQLEEMRRTQLEEVRRFEDMAREREFTIRPVVADYRPARIELPNLAQQRIDSIERAETEQRENLPVGKSLEIYVAVGGMQYLVRGFEAFSAKDRVHVEIEIFDGENFQTVNMNHDQIALIFKIVDVIGKRPDTIH